MARNQHLWVYTLHVSEVMIKLGVTNVKELQEYIFVEDLVEKGVNKVTACKILKLVGGVRYRPMSPDVAVSTNASVRVEQSSGSREAGRDAARTISQAREAEGHGAKEMPRGSYREILNRGRYREAWTLEQRSPLCVQKLQLVGMGVPPVNPPKKGFRTRSNPVKRGRPLLNRKQVQRVPRSYSNRRMRPAEVVEKLKPLQPPRGGLSFRFSRSWADLVDDDHDGALVSYAASSGESSAEEAAEAQRLKEALLQERDSKRTKKGGNVPRGSQSSNGGHQTLGEGRDKASLGETRQERSSQPAKKGLLKIFRYHNLRFKPQSEKGQGMALLLVVRWRWALRMRCDLGKGLLDRKMRLEARKFYLGKKMLDRERR